LTKGNKMDEVHEGGMNYDCIYLIVSFYRELNSYSWRFNLTLLEYFKDYAKSFLSCWKWKPFRGQRSLVCVDAQFCNCLASPLPLVDICRVCRAEGTHDKPLYHPCICTGSIKYIHQEWYVSSIRSLDDRSKAG